MPDQLSRLNIGDLEFWIGMDSRFIFFHADDRLVLVGVLSDNVVRNNYYDGPFDQVPPDLKIKSELESVYPYVKLRGGIDLHGNFILQHGMRVAISPYIVYSDTSEFVREVSRRIQLAKRKRTSVLSELVYEWKSDFGSKEIESDKEITGDRMLESSGTTTKLNEEGLNGGK